MAYRFPVRLPIRPISASIATAALAAWLLLRLLDGSPGIATNTAHAAPSAQGDSGAEASIALTAAVGTDPVACATVTSTAAIETISGTLLYFCHAATNTGDITLTQHVVTDSILGRVYSATFPLPPGATTDTVSAGVVITALAPVSPAARTLVHTVEWSAFAPATATASVTDTGDITANGGITPTDPVTTAGSATTTNGAATNGTITAPASTALTTSTYVTALSHVTVTVLSPAAAVTLTVGASSDACAAESAAAFADGDTAYLCLTVENRGDVTLTRHLLDAPQLSLGGSFTHTLPPDARLTLTTGALADLEFAPAPGLTGALTLPVTQDLTASLRYTGLTTHPFTATAQATVTVDALTPALLVTKTLGTNADECAPEPIIDAEPGTDVYYCLTVHNTGDMTLTNHAMYEPLPHIDLAFTYTLSPGDVFTLTNDVLSDTLGLPRLFGPFTIQTGLVSLLFYTATTPLDEEATDYTLAYVSILATPTSSFEDDDDDDDDDDPTWTPIPPPPATPTPAPPTPTPEPPTPPPPPTATPTPTRSYAISSLATPTPRSPVSPLEEPADALALGSQLSDADATATAIAESPLDFPPIQSEPIGEEPIESEPIEEPTPTEIPTETPIVAIVVVTNTPIPTQRPIEHPTPTPTADAVLFAAELIDSFVTAAGWIWFLGGSLVFFVVAGIIAGLAFRRQERQRFDLEEADAADRHDFWAEEEPPAQSSRRSATGAPSDALSDDKDDWPDTLP